MLPVECPAQFDSSNFRHRIRTIGELQRPGEQLIFADRLRREFRIDATRPRNSNRLIRVR